MNFNELKLKVNNENIENNDILNNIILNINIEPDNFNDWVEKVFSAEVDKFDISKLPYLIDGLYKKR